MSTINLQDKIIFTHIPKTAGTSIERVEWVGYNFSQHGSIQDIVNLNIPEYNIDKFFKFTFVRSPYTRFISGVLNHLYKHENPSVDIVRKCIRNKDYKGQTVLLPQHTFIELGNKVAIDYIGKYENLQEDFNEVSKIVGKPKTKLKHENKGIGVNYELFLTDDIREFINDYYNVDFKILGYEKC